MQHNKPGPPLDPRSREANIIGKPPRIPPLKPEEMDQEAIDSVNKVRRAVGAAPLTEVPEFAATLLRHPSLYESSMALGYQLFNGALSVRDRELAILRSGWLSQAPFEFGSHVNLGKRLVQMTDEEIARVTLGSAAPGWNDHERALLKAVEELHADAMISDETWAVLSKVLNEKQLIELPILIGQYQGIAYLQNSLRIRLMQGNNGLSL